MAFLSSTLRKMTECFLAREHGVESDVKGCAHRDVCPRETSLDIFHLVLEFQGNLTYQADGVCREFFRPHSGMIRGVVAGFAFVRVCSRLNLISTLGACCNRSPRLSAHPFPKCPREGSDGGKADGSREAASAAGSPTCPPMFTCLSFAVAHCHVA